MIRIKQFRTLYTSILFTLFQFYRILKKSNTFSKQANLIFGGVLFWGILQSVLGLTHFYTRETMTTPPRFALLLLPIILLFFWIFFSQKGKAFVDSLPLTTITWLNIVRIPVEFCLYWLFLEKAVPELMTFTGRNFDILAGVTAPIIAYFGFQQQKISPKWLLVWNIISLGLLSFIILNGLLSAPTIFQQFAFDQPNVGLAYFPYLFLPGLIVPIVLFGHFVSIRQLSKYN